MLTLDDICTLITDGSHFSPEDEGTGYPMLSVKDMCDDYFDITNCKYVGEEAYQKLVSNGCRPQVNDVVVAKDGSFLKTAFTVKEDLDIVLLSSIAILRPKLDMIAPEYLSYYLKSPCVYRTVSLNYISGTALKRIILKGLRKIPIEVPKLEEQYQRVKLLNSLKRVIKQRKTEMQKLDDLIKARFVEMFGNGHDGFCNTKRLGEFCKFQQGTQVSVEEQIEEQLEGYTRFLRIIDYTQAPQIPRYVSVKGRKIAEDSVVIVRYGATAGFVGHGYAGILANNLFEVVPDESILSKDFLYLALKYGTFGQEVHDKAFGAAMPALSFGMMNDIGVVTPNMTAQNSFVAFVEQVNKSKVAVQKALDETKLLFDSLMQQYFG